MERMDQMEDAERKLELTRYLRLAVSLMLFAGVIYLDKNQIDWKGQSAVAVISRQLETSVMGNSTVEALH